MEKIVVFGSTGNTGVCAVEAAVQKGLNVRAFVRDPSKLPDHLRDSVEVVKGNVLNYTDVHNAIKNVTAVVVVLGTRNDLSETTMLSEGMNNIIKAMKDLNVEIVSVCLSAFLFCKPEKVPQIFCKLNADHQREFDAVRNSGLKYIAILPPHIADRPSGTCEVQHDSLPSGTMIVSKYDLGKFLIDSLTQPEHYGKTCGIITKY
ncbi:hypothetical protein RN001_001444 [Aquatica leii]|uniref:NAD(P)-binding domain-containing protein n=1 Tax=Aquatica leii TaxID=1421715 RepID=A0AAN7PGA6_9COLE|nr:hypothetical protein RN001_001444 [Aquatica leii]